MICAVSVRLCLFCVYLLLLCFSVWFAGCFVSGSGAGFGYFVLVLVLGVSLFALELLVWLLVAAWCWFGCFAGGCWLLVVLVVWYILLFWTYVCYVVLLFVTVASLRFDLLLCSFIDVFVLIVLCIVVGIIC